MHVVYGAWLDSKRWHMLPGASVVLWTTGFGNRIGPAVGLKSLDMVICAVLPSGAGSCVLRTVPSRGLGSCMSSTVHIWISIILLVTSRAFTNIIAIASSYSDLLLQQLLRSYDRDGCGQPSLTIAVSCHDRHHLLWK